MRKTLLAALFLYALAVTGVAAETTTVHDRGGLIITETDAHGAITQHETGVAPSTRPGHSFRSTAKPASRANDDATLQVSAREDSFNRVISADGDFAPINSQLPATPHEPRYQQSATIDRMTLRNNSYSYMPYLPFFIANYAQQYFLADGTTWSSGAGSFTRGKVVLDGVEVIADSVTYTLGPYDDGLLIGITDYNSGNHSAVGTLHVVEPLIMTAFIGSDTATITGGLEIVTNAPANYNDDRFHYFSAIIGSVVPFTITVVNNTGTWQADSFESALSYNVSGGEVDFANPISVPALVSIDVNGPPQVPADSAVAYFAVATYDNDAVADVSDEATWTIDPSGLATISDTGVLTTGPAPQQDTELTISAVYESFSASLTVTLLGTDTVQSLSEQWTTFQGNPGHTGATPDIVDPQDFNLRWQRQLLAATLHQVVEGDGRVFATVKSRFFEQPHLFAVDAVDGEVIWQMGFGTVSSVNPPAFAYGTVYVQNGKSTSSIPLLHAINADTGNTIFSSQFAAQWENYLAPTIVDGSLYINGGTYGGMYRFNAFSGEQEWFASLPQYDEWTPALKGNTAYGYVGGKFYSLDRNTGTANYQLSDPNWDWAGYAMRGAVALASESRAVTVHNRRLICFDIVTPQIAWDWDDNFAGQPAVSEDVIYVVNAGDLYAIDLQTGAPLWTWDGPQELVGAVVITASHVFVRSDQTTYAVEIGSRSSDWSYPAAGWLSVGDQNLYIAGEDGMLTAISMPVISASLPVSIELLGPDSVEENTTAAYRAMVTFDDGRIRNRTYVSDWQIDANEVASISDRGELAVVELIAPRQNVNIAVSYIEGGVQLQDDKMVQLYTPLSNAAFAVRNLESADLIINSVIDQLIDALRHERSARNAIKSGSIAPRPNPIASEISDALLHTRESISEAEQGVLSIEEAIRLLQEEDDGPE